MALDFKAHYFQAFAYVPSYSDWLLDADLTSTYRYERRALKLLQWGSPTRPWRLKCPSHLLWLDHLDEVFPDARFVMTHRDPTEVMVSVADLGELVGEPVERSRADGVLRRQPVGVGRGAVDDDHVGGTLAGGGRRGERGHAAGAEHHDPLPGDPAGEQPAPGPRSPVWARPGRCRSRRANACRPAAPAGRAR